jgi:hypothetical protein
MSIGDLNLSGSLIHCLGIFSECLQNWLVVIHLTASGLWLPGSSDQAIEVGFGLAWPEPSPVSVTNHMYKPRAPKKQLEWITVVKATTVTAAMVDAQLWHEFSLI